MERVQHVLAFDLATQTGWAMGGPGDSAPKSSAVRLRDSDDPVGEAERNIRHLFLDLKRYKKPDLVVFETPWSLGAWFEHCKKKGRIQNAESLLLQNTLARIVAGECLDFGIPYAHFARSTVLKHFTGRATWSSGKGAGDGRDIGKAMVLKRCAQLGYLPPGAKNDDQADAIAMWDLGVSKYGGRVPSSLEFFDGGKMTLQANG